jgi:hypothetical protein
MYLMRGKLSEGICLRDDPPFFWYQESGRTRRLGITKAICLHELRLFSLHHTRAELAPVAIVAPERKLRLWTWGLSVLRFFSDLRLDFGSEIVVCL